MINPGRFASQGNFFAEDPLSRYMTKNSRLKFWKIKNLKKEEKDLIEKRINERLTRKRPFWRFLTDYDYLGILGQAIGIKRLNNPFRVYCSEQILEDVLKDVIQLAIEKDGLIIRLPQHPSPNDINEYFKYHPRMEVYGRWSAD
jgi:hypothetical protein